MAGKWCGPYALALISGKTYDEAYEHAKKKLRKRSIMGMYNHEFKAVARSLGFKKFEWNFDPKAQGKPTLRSFKDWMRPNRLYVVVVTRHYVTVNTSDWTVQCNQTQKWEPIDECKHARKKVNGYAEVMRMEKAGE
jgi:hypothetical protein